MAVIRVLEAISAGFGVVWQRGETQDVSDDLARLLVTQRRAEYVSPPAAPADWLVPVMKKVDEAADQSSVSGALLARPNMGALGNSWVAQGKSAGDLTAKGFVTWVAARLGNRVRLKRAAVMGYAGEASTSIMTHINEFCAALGPGFALVEMLINDATSGVAFEQSVENVNLAVEKMNAAGIVPIFQTIPPRGDANNTIANRQRNYRMNDWLISRAASAPRGSMYVVDVASEITSRAFSSATQIAGAYGTDNVHPIDFGAYSVATPYVTLLNSLLPPASLLPAYRTTQFSRSAYPTGWLNSNPSMFGAAGTIVSGGAGTLADGLSMARTLGTAFTANPSKIAGKNNGEFQRFTLGATGLGLANEQIEISVSATGAEIGDTVEGVLAFSADDLVNVKGIYLYVNGAASGLYRTLNPSGITGDALPGNITATACTFEIPILATEALTARIVLVAKCDTAAPSGTVDVQIFGVRVLAVHA